MYPIGKLFIIFEAGNTPCWQKINFKSNLDKRLVVYFAGLFVYIMIPEQYCDTSVKSAYYTSKFGYGLCYLAGFLTRVKVLMYLQFFNAIMILSHTLSLGMD